MKLLITAIFFVFCQVSMAQAVHAHKVRCAASGVSGDSVAEVIQNCAQHERRSRGECSKAVSCANYFTHCSAKGYAGDNVAAAVQNCVQFGNYDQRLCLRSVSCR